MARFRFICSLNLADFSDRLLVAVVLLSAAGGYLKYRHDIYQDHSNELKLRAELANTASAQAAAVTAAKNLRDEINNLRDPGKRQELQARLDGQKQQLQKLQAESEAAAKQLATHQNDSASKDDPLLTSAYAQIDKLQAQLNALRGHGNCAPGYVWREASPTDQVCVTTAVRDRTANENKQAGERRAGSGDYGADTCKQGYVWRDAFPGDHVCVEPGIRDQVANDNRQAQNRLAMAQ